MTLSTAQRGVRSGIIAGTFITVVAFCLAAFINLSQLSAHLSWLSNHSIVIIVIPLIGSIAMLAKYRFFSAEDIDGAGLTHATQMAKMLQAILQNTLEQDVLAIATYTTWMIRMPKNTLGMLAIGSILFIIGRITFCLGYKHGAATRSFGFTITFYPTVILLIVALCYP